MLLGVQRVTEKLAVIPQTKIKVTTTCSITGAELSQKSAKRAEKNNDHAFNLAQRLLFQQYTNYSIPRLKLAKVEKI